MIGVGGTLLLALLIAGAVSTTELVRATAACFIAVYLLVLASAVRILDARTRLLATVTLALIAVLAVFSAWYLLVPVAAGAAALALRRSLHARSTLPA